MNRFLLSLALGAAAVSTPALAGDFDGPYIGAQAGVALLHVEGDILTGPVDKTSTTGYGAAVLGYRLDAGGVVLGIEGDAGTHVDGGDARYGVSAIAGLPIGSRSLVYGRVGYVWHDGLPADVGKGVTVGGGFETKLTGPVNVRLDYKYLALGKTDIPDNTLSYTGHEVTAGVVIGF
ncbi:MAG: outer membrane beta-barrel protein [Candidatus Andeanibacterium colombiense]|uniref:Outer membrane beta-barrel protein n=1 Tax=Candidatus Andeanibacterium colombiense TaxID=3121345 RepID=A0AAJ6BPY9_9SPHN|nr:MAG: outer membrane beta-barrel protein [Sphingomonadaceae bacterium]